MAERVDVRQWNLFATGLALALAACGGEKSSPGDGDGTEGSGGETSADAGDVGDEGDDGYGDDGYGDDGYGDDGHGDDGYYNTFDCTDLADCGLGQICSGAGIDAYCAPAPIVGDCVEIPEVQLLQTHALGAAQLRAADLDGDGDEELLVRTAEAIVLLDGATATPEALAVPVGDFDLGDVDGSGTVDLAVVDAGSVDLWAGDGQGGFSSAGASFSLPGSGLVAVADYEGDGPAEVAFASSGGIRVFGLVEGNLELVASSLGGLAATPHAFDAGDFTKPGEANYVAADALQAHFARPLGGELRVDDLRWNHFDEGPPPAALFGDLNEDEGSDYVVSLPLTALGATPVLLGVDGDGLSIEQVWLTLPTLHEGAGTLDFDGDGYDELVFGADGAGLVRLLDAPALWGSGLAWCSAELFEWTGATLLLGADLDGDGRDELIVSDGEELRVYGF